jgi:hypothetical protein
MIMKLIQAVVLLSLSSLALANPVDAARSHINAITAGDVKAIMADYGEGAVFQWVGGPLDGVYHDSQGIQGVWTKFVTKVKPGSVEFMDLETSANPKGTTVDAKVIFLGKKTIKVHYVMVYRGGKLVNEVWQIDPNMSVNY